MHTCSTLCSCAASPALSAADRDAALAITDLTDPSNGDHALQLVIDGVVRALSRAWACDVHVVRRSPVVAIADNYDALGIPADVVARDVRHSRYVDGTRMLRSHTSALVPPELRALAARTDPIDDVLLACPGIVYRRDLIDRLHTGTPHMVDLWRVTQTRQLGPDDLYEMIDLVVESVLPGARRRTEPRTHAYTEHGLQIDIRSGGEWVEVGECGLASPAVLERAGLVGASGLAMGIGLDRVVMLRKGIPDIRLLRATDPRIGEQMVDLAPYRPVSTRPAIRRDVSIAVAAGTTDEQLGDRARTALGGRADLVEAIEVVSRTAGTDLPAAAAARLGIGPADARERENVLLRVVLRALDRTLTDDEANELRDRLLAALHEGAPGWSGFGGEAG